MTEKTKQNRASWWVQHRGLWINLASIFLVIGLKGISFEEEGEWLTRPLLLLVTLLVIFVLEPWAIYYSMGALNQRRNLAGLAIPKLQANLKGTPGLILWAARVSIYGAFLVTLLNQHYGSSDQVPGWLHFVAIISVFIRESLIVFWFLSTKGNTDFSEPLDLFADLFLLMGLVLGELLVFEVFQDMGLNGTHTTKEYLELLFPILLLCLVFYLPIRFLYTLEDITFAQSRWEKAERLISFLLVFISFLVLGPSLAG